ncbi:MAG TPA: hypothetical protein VJV79_07905 [Polyangiaceae bacterium]|nr:hypothetical protein [Polyangiaceae bacterium]
MLIEVAERLETFVIERNLEARSEGTLALKPCVIKLLGQTALLEAKVSLTLAATNDVDVYADYEFAVEQEFRRLLATTGHALDPLGGEIWMPAETTYQPLFVGHCVTLLVADAESVLVSKALKAARKNRPLLTEYLARGPSARFLKLARKYRLDLEQFL